MAAPVTTGNQLSVAEGEATKGFAKWACALLIAIAVIYALLAGLRTLTDYDLGWQLASGRWILQHHRVPSTDVFSYTAQGQPWIYPVGASLLFYAAFLLGGYGLLSWLGAAACAGSVALLLRRGTMAGAGLAVVGMPLIAARTAPRADMFTVVLFSAFLSLLWEHFQTGHAKLWLLPLLMVAWVNLHLGFVAGLALVGGYVGLEVLEIFFGGNRRAGAVERIRRAWPWLAAIAFATLVNPWGWKLYSALVWQSRAMTAHAEWISEWASTPISWNAIAGRLSIQDARGALFLLLAAALVAAVIAGVRRQPGVVVLMLCACYEGIRHVRFGALFACVAIVVGGWMFASAAQSLSAAFLDPRLRKILTAGFVLFFAVLALARSVDLVTNRTYLSASDPSTFGAGLSWWFPERALAFVEREKLPAKIFNDYNLGGFLVWRLGEKYQAYLDGRAIPFGPDIFERQAHLMEADPDGPEWRLHADALGINTLIFSLARYNGEPAALPKFCASQSWKLVYLDEVSAIFVRKTSQNDGLIQRFKVDCANFKLPGPAAGASRSQAFNYWANAMLVLNVAGRNQEAWDASNRALALFPNNAHLHFIRASILSNTGALGEAEQQYLLAAKIDPKDLIWMSLADLYRREGRSAEAEQALKRALDISPRPHQLLINSAFPLLLQRNLEAALATVDEAVRLAPPEAASNRQFQIDVLRARAAALNGLGQNEESVALEEKAVRLRPECPDLWLEMAKLYESNGRSSQAAEARSRAAQLEAAQP